ncbi:breast cancer type 2 susceptibility protein [Oryzias melastigma]|uniref:BRCA2 DNA repair associated n=1 Tax=Oryzias melastigma TaxID=30732 RepID=A0A3B3B7M7_ORYME|nr:breast cancer type 2 susceptibility protein [Oryzias melastigma]
MDLPLTNMYNIFKDDVWKALVLELGPLDPNWFEVLTSQASVIDGSLSDQEDLCANQEGNSKGSLEKPAVESQFFSTPKVFRHSRVVSPQTEDEQSFTLAQEKGALPWIKTQSPCLFQLTIQGEKCDVFQPQGDDSFDLLATPNQSTISYAKHISESLGAQMNPDISWTSSLNTPPAVPSTLILPIPDNKPCSTNVPADGNVVFVRKLFPSLSKTSANEASKSCDPVAFQGPISPKVPDGPQTFSNHEECVWQQKVPDTIEDEEVRSSVVDVLDGAEDALSIFFANSSSALRKVKPERNKRKQILQAKENVCSSKDDLSTSKATSDEERDGCTLSSYTKTGHTGMSQWSPLSLSDIPSCSAGGIIVPEQLHNSSRLSGPSKDIQNVEFQSKTRLFDTVGIAELDPMRVDSSIEIPYSEELCIEQLGSSDCSNAEKTEGHKQGQPLGENLVGTVKAKIQDIDMSQLCRDFAQDFSQMPDSGRTASRDHFSPSACLLAMKKAKQKAEVNPQHHPNKSISNPKFPTSGVPVNDSGFHSAVANSTNITGSSFLENTGLSRTSTDFKSDLQTETDIPSTKAFPKTMHFNPEAEMELISAHTSKEEKDLEPVMSTDITVQKPSSAQGADDIPSIPLNDQKQTKETSTSPLVVHSLGFKTASNKGIRISSASLEKAKLIFKETESETAFYNLPTTSGYDTMNKSTSKEAGNTSTFSSKPSQTSITETFGGITPQLTASQTDDVTELCSLLEKTDSQFELTPVKILKTKQQNNATSPQKADRELDPDLLAGIDFDDSFSSDSLQCARNENATYSSKHSSEDEASDDPRKTVRASSPQNVSSVAFKTAGGKVLRVSDKCLSKAKSLFADLEEFPTNRKSSGNKRVEIGSNTKQKSSMDGCKKNLKFAINEDSCSIRAGNCFEELASFKKPTKSISGDDTKSSESKKNDPNMCQTGFFMANGKNICVQAKNMHHAKDIFKDCDVTDNKSEFIKHLPENVKRREHLSKYDNFDIPKRRIDGCSVTENADLLPCDTIEPHQGILKVETNVAPFHRNSFSASKPDLSMLCSASKTIDSNESCSAAGKKAFVSADETKNSEYLLKETHSPEDGKGQLQEDWSSSNHTDQPRICGFQTAAGKELIVSSAALKKAQTMFSENEGVKERNRVIPPHSRIPSIESENDKSHALQKAKVCSNISLNAVNPCGNKLKEGPNNVEKMCSGFTTTNKANEFEENLLKSNHSLKDFDLVSDKEMQESDVFLENHVDAENTVLPKDQECQLPVYEKIKSNPDQKPTISFSQPGCPEDPPSFQNAGFQMANGKAVTFSAEALRKAKSVFNECEAPEDNTLQSKATVLQDLVDNKERIHFGFQTAGGAKVHVSKTNLLKAKHLFKDFDDLVSDKEMQEADVLLKNVDVNAENGVLTKDWECKNPLKEGGNEEVRSNPNQRTTLNFSEPEDGSSENTKILQNDLLSFQNVGFQTANGKAVTFSSEALRKAKSMFNGCEALEDKTLPTPLQSNANVLPFRGTTEQNQDIKERIHFGFQTAGGTKVHVSKTNLLKAKHLFKDLDDSVSKATEGTDPSSETSSVLSKATGLKDNISKHDQIIAVNAPANGWTESRNVGFQTASGSTVVVSDEALKRAKTLLGEGEEVANVSSPLCKIPVSGSSGFFAASGKAVTFSSEALQKAKSLFSDIRADVSDFTDTKRVEQKQEDAQLWGFTAAGRTKTDTKVADKCHSNIKKLDLNNAKDVSSDVDLTNLAPSETVVQSENYKLETSQVMDYKRPENTKAEESSALMFPSLNLTGCTETQHRLLAQEALDCTKALLEDEDLAGQSFCPAAQTALRLDYPQATTGSDAEEKRQRKRLMGDPDPTGQPPLKRQLLEEFNQTNDGSNDSGLQPVKSCPLGLMKDRGVFKYSTSLYPNITKPHSNGKTKTTTTVQHSTPDNSRSAGSKMSPFIPPFYKNANSETSKTSVPQLTTRTPVFAPPFKKQRTVLQGKTDQNTNKLSPVTESNSSAYVPSSKNAQEPSNVISTVNTHSNDTKNPNVDVNGGSVRFMSHPDQAFSKDEHQVFLNSELARDMQDMRIRKKKRQNIRPLQGSLFLTKTSGVAKIPLKAAVNGKLPTRCPPEQLYRRGVHAHVSGITSETAESFRFRLLHFFKRDTFIDEGGVKLADGGWLIPTKDGTAGKEEFFRALCDTPGVDPKLITEAWGYNHYRWIVWKQASMEKSFPEAMGGICLTPEQVLLQLKYRYDVEVDHSRRPALRKITEKDDTAAKTLVLCVCGIVSKGGGASGSRTPESSDPASAVVWLTDGWYALKAQLDQPLTAMLNKGLLPVGGKLIIHGAQLVGSQDACPPLEAPESLMLKICANSTRRARWDTKLGFHKDPRPFLLPIASLFSRGGPVGCADVVVLRSYPIQWMERKADGGVVFRTTRAEEREARRFSEVKHKAMEVLFAKVQTEFENEEKEKTKSQRRKQNLDVANLQDGEELHAAVGDDPAYLEAHLSEQQLQTLQAYKRSLMERKQAELQDRYRRALEEEDQEIKCPKRDVTPVWRLSVADSLGPPSCVYQLSLWRPSSDVESLLKEGGRFKVYNLAAAEGKKRSSHESVQLTGTKKTQFQVLQTSQEWMSERFQPRVSTDFESLQNPDFRPLCGEVDLSGYVVSVIDGHGSSPAFYLADGKLNLVKIRCFSSLSQTGLEDVVKPRVLLALSNLQLRGQSMFPTPVVYAGDLTVFSTNPKEAHLQESLSHLKNRIQRDENFHGNAEEKLSHLIKSGGLGLVSPMAVKLQTLPSSSDKKDESKITFQKPASFTPVSKNPQAETPLSKKDPKILKRRRALDYLSRIPSPPPLSVLGSVSSPCVKKTFNPPRRSGPPSQFKTEKIQTVKPSVVEDEWVNDEELVMIDTQALGIK